MKFNPLGTRARHVWRREIRPLLLLALVVCSIRSSLADWNDVPSGSMKPTILEGDRVYVNKLAYDLKVPFTTWHLAQWSDPERGDIVVFFSPYDGKRLVKRVIGLPGDTLELRNDRLILNGKPIEYQPIGEERLRDLAASDRDNHLFAVEQLEGQAHPVAAFPQVPARRDFGPYRVPEGHYFMMGDNRDDSFDSRYYGPVERKRIIGKASSVVLSFDRQHLWSPRWHRFFSSLNG
ncbi:MAG TPA: signal peptidase I [Candidatus Limnocylindrales bacterium]|nr:signal peptidase I [Candidatus Limnocylindrales bacterium]